MTWLLSVVACALLALPGCTAISAATTHATTDLSSLATKTPAGTYKSDKDHTTLTFKVRHFNFSNFVGRFDDIDATLEWDPANPTASKLDVVVNTSSIDTRVAALNSQLQAAAMFDSKTDPKAHFVSTQITETGTNAGEIRGDLTIKGQTHPVTLEVTFNGGDVNGLTGQPTLGFSATARINRTTWGLGEWFPVVGNDVKLEIEAEFVKASPPVSTASAQPGPEPASDTVSVDATAATIRRERSQSVASSRPSPE